MTKVITLRIEKDYQFKFFTHASENDIFSPSIVIYLLKSDGDKYRGANCEAVMDMKQLFGGIPWVPVMHSHGFLVLERKDNLEGIGEKAYLEVLQEKFQYHFYTHEVISI
jgi:hypothetical protein